MKDGGRHEAQPRVSFHHHCHRRRFSRRHGLPGRRPGTARARHRPQGRFGAHLQVRIRGGHEQEGAPDQPIGDDRFAVQISAKDKEKVDAVKDLITDLGHLQFRITVEPKASDNHVHYWKLFAEAKAKGVDEQTATYISPADVKPDEKDRFPEGLRWYRIGDEQRERFRDRGARNEAGEPQPWVLCELDNYDVTGEHLKNVFHAREQGGLGTGWAVY
ncbi:MAG: hypothetical protein ACYTGU_18340, partial [Planctomycetota bacterium]